MSTLNSECARKWWLISAGAGVVVAFIAGAVLGVWWLGSLLLGVIVGGVMGYVTVRAQCEETDIEAARPQEPARPAPKPAAPAPAAPTPAQGTDAATTPQRSDPGPTQGADTATTQGTDPATTDAVTGQDAKPAPAGAPLTDGSAAGVGTAPSQLDGPRGGVPDDLKRMRGLGPKFEERLNELGIYHFDQIAGWSADEVAWIEAQMNMSGRVAREDWIAQARRLAAGEAE